MTVPSVEMLLIAGRAVFLVFSFVLATIACLRWRKAVAVQTEAALANHNIVLQRLADLDARVAATNVTVSQWGERIQQPQQLASSTSASPQGHGYQIAIRLAKGGASREELISGCGLSTHEAELVHRLHAPQAKTTPRKSFSRTPNAA